MNTREDRAKLKKLLIILESEFCPTILMGRLVGKIHPETDSVMQWYMQAGNITTTIKFKVYFTLPALSATHVVTCKCHVDDFAKGIYNMILGQDILT